MKKEQLFKSFHYFVNYPSFSKTHREVKVFYIYKYQNVIKPILIKKVKGHDDEAYYINEAKKIIDSLIKNNELEQDAIECIKRQKREKRLRVAIPSVGVCCALAAGAVGLYIALRPISFKKDTENMLKEYQTMVAPTIDTTFYENKTVDDILKDTEDRPMIKKEIHGITTYYFSDIIYDDLETRADEWPAKEHIWRGREMAVCAYKNKRPDLMKLAGQVLSYWVFSDHRSGNWWWNEIGANRDLTGAAIYCFDSMPALAQQALLGRLEQSSFYYRPALKTHTGANLVDFAEITLKSSLLRKNKDEFESAVSRMEQEITDENIEGFQKDGEFFQHGRQVNTTSSYGLSALRMGNFMRVVGVSQLREFRKDKLAIISRFINEGLVGATHKGYMNYFTMGREYVRQDHLITETKLADLKNFFEVEGLPEVDEIKEYAKHLDNHESTFSGLKYFDDGRIIALNTDGLYISFKGVTDNLTSTECNNQENKLGLNMSYGTNTCVMDTGEEYNNIIPVWDYAYMPGTTSYQLAPETYKGTDEDGYDKYLHQSDLLINTIKDGKDGTTYYEDGQYEHHLPSPTENPDFVYEGGYDKEHNVAYLMQRSCHHKENYFTVTCIATPDGMVLVGAGLTYDGSVTEAKGLFTKDSRCLHTTVEQAFAKPGQTFLSNDDKELIFGNALYRSLDGNNIQISNETLKGHWKRNHKEAATDTEVPNKTVMKAYFDHGAASRKDMKYAYSIQHKNNKDKKFELIHNFDTNKIQEVKLPNGLYAIIAYEDKTGYETEKGDVIDLKKGDFILI